MSSRALRILAACSMLVDHIGAIFLENFTREWYVLRGFGRLAFPIFCFLICEGYEHTKSLPRYMGRLALFALISEVPYDLAFKKELVNNEHSNVFITLLLGLIAVTAAGTGARYILRKLKASDELCDNVYMQTLCAAPVIYLCMLTAHKLHTDYGWAGVAIIYILYLFRKDRAGALIALAFANWLTLCVTIKPSPVFFGMWTMNFHKTIQWAAPLACIPLWFYNGQNGNVKMKLFFYFFYPAHLAALWFLWLLTQ